MDMLLPGTIRMPMKTTKAQFGITSSRTSHTSEMTEPLSGRKPVLALLLRLLWAAALALPVFGAQAAVVFTNLHSFGVFTNGANPSAALVQGSDRSFYGTTSGGGTNGGGTVFKISTDGVLTTLYSFGGSDGANPSAALVQGSDGNFYGTTQEGGEGDYGTVFKINTNGVLTSLYSFTGTDGSANPNGLVQGKDGNFYGTTEGYPYGTVFKISTNGALTTLHTFGNSGGVLPNGLVQGSDGSFYGTTEYEGFMGPALLHYYGNGTVFKISTNGAFTFLYSFTGGNDGAYPAAGLVEGRDGNFYGTTEYTDGEGGQWGGTSFYGAGTVFRLSPDGALTSLYSFAKDGANPSAALVQGSDGSFYGTTYQGGTNGSYGTLFKISSNGAFTSLYSFTGGNDGANPQAALVQGSDGNFYGTTENGGAGGGGTVFRLTIVPEPQLTIIPSGPYVILTWPTNHAGFSCTGFTLQSTTNLGSSAVWTTNSSPPVVIGGQNVVINAVSGRQHFYRLNQRLP